MAGDRKRFRRAAARSRPARVAAAAALALAAGASLPPGASADGLTLVGDTHLSPRLEELSFVTPALTGVTKVRVLLPAGYDASGTRYPVLYLLHGANEDQTSWTAARDAVEVTAPDNLIVVMPDGGIDGGYTNWYNWGKFGPPEWETYHIGQLVPWIDGHFRTDATRAGRAIAGVSMGGGGALHYAADHPDMFVAAASFSGAVDNSNAFMQPLNDATGVADGRLPASACGLWQTEEIRCRGINALDLGENLRGLFLQLDTGNGFGGGHCDGYDPVENGVYQQNVAFHERLGSLGIPHIWDYYGSGCHDNYYFNRDLTEFMPRLMNVFAHPPGPPSPLDFTSIASSYGVYGWRVTVSRPAIEWSELRDAGPLGFELRGSGTGLVSTAPYYSPGQPLFVEVQNSDGSTTELMHADKLGRLTVGFALGPGNPYQEYTPQATAWLSTRDLLSDPGQELDANQDWPVYTASVSITPPAPGQNTGSHGR